MTKWLAAWWRDWWQAALVLGFSIAAAASLWWFWVTRGIGLTFDLVVGAAARAASAPVPTGPAPSDAIAQIGQSGDAFGGGNALFAALAGALVFWAGYLQAKALKEARVAYAHQQFESTFFELLKLTRELQERFKTTSGFRIDGLSSVAVERVGPEALDSFAASIWHTFRAQTQPAPTYEDMARALVREFATSTYGSNPSAFGPYFRSLYQTFKHVAESQLNDDDKKRFANIARGQISEGAVFLLALNGLTDLGFNFIKYIEEFGLLEHMHRKYLATYRPALLVGYHERAFLGSTDRRAHPMVAPKQGKDFFVGETPASTPDPTSAG